MMTCEEFEDLGLDFDREPACRAAAEAHLGNCARCAAWLESCRELRGGLRALAAETASSETPLHVELALREAVRGQLAQTRRRVPAWTWALAAAAVVVLITWLSWHLAGPITPSPRPDAPQVAKAPPRADADVSAKSEGGVTAPNTPAVDAPSGDLAAQSASDEGFVALPYAAPAVGEGDTSVVRVRLQRGELGAWGLPVNEEQANEWVQVDLLVAEDGQPQAVRLAR